MIGKLATALVAGTLVVSVPVTADARTYPHVHVRQLGAHAHNLRPCPHEDSSNCVWDAKHRGNHYGVSYFVTKHDHVVRIDGDGDVRIDHVTFRITYK